MEGSKLQLIGQLFKRKYKEKKNAINDVNDLSDQKLESKEPERLSPKKHIFHYNLQICMEKNIKGRR